MSDIYEVKKDLATTLFNLEFDGTINMEEGDELKGMIRAIEDDVAENYVELPVDADGVSIHPEDHVSDGATEWVVTGIEYTSHGHVLRGYSVDGPRTEHAIDQPRRLRHVVAPTVAAALRSYRKKAVDLHSEYLSDGGATYGEYKSKLAVLDAEFATKLRLVGDAE